MHTQDRKRIVSDPEMLTDAYLPQDITLRKHQTEEIKACLLPAIRKEKPMHAWLYGKPGSGKTSAAKSVLRELEKQTPVRGVCINCWRHPTLHSVIDKIVREIRILCTDQQNSAAKMERLMRHLGEQPFVIVLDEIDRPPRKDRNAIIYNLCGLGKIGLICICNSRSFLYDLDERIKSRLSPVQIEFGQYSGEDLVSILVRRAELALVPGSWSRNVLERIAELAEGDARVAIQTLKKTADYAESEESDRITQDHVERGWKDTRHIRKTYLLKSLTEHHRIFYQIIKETKGIQSGELWNAYLKACDTKKAKPVALRTYSLYVNKLKNLGLIKADRAMVRGKVRVFGVVE